MLFSMLSGYDKEMMEKWIDVYARENVSTSNSPAPLSNLLSYWNLEKKNLFKLFGGQLIISKTVDFKKPIYLLEEEMDCMIYNDEQGRFRDRVNHLTYWSDNEELKGVHYDVMNLFAPSTLASNEYKYENFKIPTPNGKYIQVQKGCKPVKILGKLAAAYNIEGFEEFRLAHSLVLNQKSLKGDLCLSIHPMDYMTMSDNECDWDSCMSWRNEGCYRRGTIEMMNSPYVIVAYLKAKEDMTWWKPWRSDMPQEDYVWNNKKWRELFVVDRNCITGVKGYPYQNTALEEIVMDWVAELAQKNLGWEYKEGVHEYSHYGWFEVDGQRWNLGFTTDDMYNDFGTRNHYAKVANVPAGEDIEVRINYSGCHPCMYCGQLHGDYEDEGGLVCGDCCNYFYCECCDERIYNEEPYFLDGNRLCEYCYNDSATECAITHEYHYSSNMTELHFAVMGEGQLQQYDDPCIYVYEHDLTDEDWKRYFKIKSWHRDNSISRWDTLYYVTPEDLTEEGFELFDFCGLEDVAAEIDRRNRRKEEAEERRKAEQKAMDELITKRMAEIHREQELQEEAEELSRRIAEQTMVFMANHASDAGESLTDVVRGFFARPWVN